MRQWQTLPACTGRCGNNSSRQQFSFLYQSISATRPRDDAPCQNYTHVYFQIAEAYARPCLYTLSCSPDCLVPPPQCTHRRRQRRVAGRRRRGTKNATHAIAITPSRRFVILPRSHPTGDPRRVEVSVGAQAVAKRTVMPVSFTGREAEMRIARRKSIEL